MRTCEEAERYQCAGIYGAFVVSFNSNFMSFNVEKVFFYMCVGLQSVSRESQTHLEKNSQALNRMQQQRVSSLPAEFLRSSLASSRHDSAKLVLHHTRYLLVWAGPETLMVPFAWKRISLSSFLASVLTRKIMRQEVLYWTSADSPKSPRSKTLLDTMLTVLSAMMQS